MDDDEIRVTTTTTMMMMTTTSVKTNIGDCTKRSCQRIRGLWTSLPGKTRTVSCRTSTVLFAFIICVHVVLLYSINMSAAVDLIVRKQALLVAVPNGRDDDDKPTVEEEEEGLSRRRRRRELTEEGVNTSIDEENISADADAKSQQSEEFEQMVRGRPRTKKSFESTGEGETKTTDLIIVKSSTRPSYEVCRSGHIQGFSNVCEAQPCLRRLTSLSVVKSLSDSPPSPSKVNSPSSQTLRSINHISGRLDTVHLSLVPFITNFQWSNGIYGSVGEFGVSMGKFTALLSIYTDVDSAERLFVADSFNRSTVSRPPISGLSPFQIFTAHLKDFGFSEEHSGLRKLYLHRGTSSTFDRQTLARWDLPQFRIVSIDADLDRLALSADLEMAACLLRDGGIVIVNGVDDTESRQATNSVLLSFFTKHGQSALTPILSAGNKLYLTTSNWKRKYIESLSNDVLLTHVGLVQSSDVIGYFSRETLGLRTVL